MTTYQKNPSELDGAPDLCQLVYLAEPNVLHNLQHRYEHRKIYTSTTSKVLIAVNPYESVPGNDSDATLSAYQQAPVNLEGLLTADGLEPHVFTVAHAAYHNMCAKKDNQSVVVCGESGAGKTESAKLFMKFLAYTSTVTSVEPQEFSEAQKIGQQVLDANPILESFGNAKTVLNNNSSRFGKFTKMLFADRPNQHDARLIGAVIETYLLEKSRVVRQDPGERNYHAFYFLLAHAQDMPTLELTGRAADYNYLQASAGSAEEMAAADADGFGELCQALDTLSVAQEEQQAMFRLVAGILHLGNVRFEQAGGGEVSSISNMEALETAARVMHVDAQALTQRLLTRNISVEGKVIVSPLNAAAAEANRDSIAKGLYDGLFLWVVERINTVSGACSGAGQAKHDTQWIGTLDVFGFEIFANNSFEQFCINFANERLQSFFNYHVLQAEQQLYRREALLWTPIDLPDNQDVIDLVMGRPSGIFATLDSACMQPQGDHTVFTHNLFASAQRSHPRLQQQQRDPAAKKGARRGSQFTKFNGFSITHYAGEVTYDASQFLCKNQDSTSPDTASVFGASSNAVVAKVCFLKAGAGKGGARPRRGSLGFTSVGSVFSYQLERLMQTLKATTPYFVRCIKPNTTKQPATFVEAYVQPQLRYGGLIEALRIIKCGFPTRCSYKRMHEHFGAMLANFPSVTNLNQRDFTEAIVRVCGGAVDRSSYQLGLSMIFFKPGQQTFFQALLELGPEDISPPQQQAIHAFLIHKRIVRMRGSIRSWVRLRHLFIFRRLQKAASVMSIINKTMMRSARRARLRCGDKQAAAAELARAKDAKYQAALRAQEQLQAMTAQEQQCRRQLDVQSMAAAEAQRNLAATAAQLTALRQTQTAATERLLALEEAARTAEATTAARSRELQTARAEVERLGSQLRQAQQQVVEEQRQSQQHAASLADARRSAASAGDQASATAVRVATLEQELRTQKTALESRLDALHDELRAKQRASAEREADLERERATVQQARDRLRNELDSARAGAEQSAGVGQEQSRRAKELETELRAKLAQHEEAARSREAEQRAARTELEGTIADLQQSLADSERGARLLRDNGNKGQALAAEREAELEEALRVDKKNVRATEQAMALAVRERDSALTQAHTQLAMLQSQFASAQTTLASKDQLLDAAAQQLDELRRQTADDSLAARRQREEEVEGLRAKLSTQKSQGLSLEDQLRHAQGRAQQLEGSVSVLQDTLEHEAEAARRKAKQLEEQLRSAVADVKRQQGQALELSRQRAAKEAELTASVSSLQLAAQQWEQRCGSLRDEGEETVRRLKRELRRAVDEPLAEAQGQLAAATRTITALQEEAQQLAAAREEVRVREQGQQEREVQEAVSGREAAEARASELQGQLGRERQEAEDSARRLRSAHEETEDEADQLRRKLGEVTSQLGQAASSIEGKDATLRSVAHAEQELRQLHADEVERLQSELQDCEHRTQEAEAAVAHEANRARVAVEAERGLLAEAGRKFVLEADSIRARAQKQVEALQEQLEEERRRRSSTPSGPTPEEKSAREAKARQYEERLVRYARVESELLHDMHRVKEEVQGGRRVLAAKDRLLAESTRMFEAQLASNQAAITQMQKKNSRQRADQAEAAEVAARATRAELTAAKAEARELRAKALSTVQAEASFRKNISALQRAARAAENSAAAGLAKQEARLVAEAAITARAQEQELQQLRTERAELQQGVGAIKAATEERMLQQLATATTAARAEGLEQLHSLQADHSTAQGELEAAELVVASLRHDNSALTATLEQQETALEEARAETARLAHSLEEEAARVAQLEQGASMEQANHATQIKVLNLQLQAAASPATTPMPKGHPVETEEHVWA